MDFRPLQPYKAELIFVNPVKKRSSSKEVISSSVLNVFPILTTVVDGIRQIDKRYFEVSQVFEIPKKKLIKDVIIPASFPQVMTGLKTGLGNAWICVVAAEMIAATSGIGYMLMDGRSLSMPGQVILSMLVVGIVGKLMDDILQKLQKKLLYY